MDEHAGVGRRTILKLTSLAGLAPVLPTVGADRARADGFGPGPFEELEEATIDQLRRGMERGEFSAEWLARMYLERIEELDQRGPTLRSVIEVDPDALRTAEVLDRERAAGHVRGPLHGIPMLVKDNIATADRMHTTSGSLALLDARVPRDAFVAHELRRAGVVILGKTNQSEWANFRSTHSSSGWSGRGGQCENPYVLDRNPWGSSSGSGTAISANLAAASLGTETDGSIVLPAAATGIVGIKPTVGLTSRAGVIPISHTQDTVGPMARTVHDAALVLGALTGVDPRDPATAASRGRSFRDYTRFLDPDGLRGARIGVPRKVYFGYSEKADAIVDAAIDLMRAHGAVVVDPADIPTAEFLTFEGTELEVLLYEFKADLNAYLAGLVSSPVRTLADVIRFDEQHRRGEMPYFDQELFHEAQAKGPLTDRRYRDALRKSHQLSRDQGIDAVMDRFSLDALVMPTTNPPWKTDLVDGDHVLGLGSTPAAQAGYPLVNVPAGFTSGLPVGLIFTGRAWSEPTLIRLAYAFEQASTVRRTPRFVPSGP